MSAPLVILRENLFEPCRRLSYVPENSDIKHRPLKTSPKTTYEIIFDAVSWSKKAYYKNEM